MARAQDPNSANSQFYIMFMPRLNMDRSYTVFGRVVGGMNFVDAIERGEPPSAPSRIVRASLGTDNVPPMTRRADRAPKPRGCAAAPSRPAPAAGRSSASAPPCRRRRPPPRRSSRSGRPRRGRRDRPAHRVRVDLFDFELPPTGSR